MILINGVKKIFSQKEKELYGKRIVYKLVDRLYTWDEENKRMKCPSLTPIQTVYNWVDPNLGEMVEVRYTQGSLKKDNGDIEYRPDYIELNNRGKLVVKEFELDLNFFLQNSPLCDDNKHKDITKRSLFMIDDPQKAAKKKTRDTYWDTKINAMLFIPDYKFFMDDQKIRNIALKRKIQNANFRSIEELRWDLSVLSKKDPQRFVEFYSKDDYTSEIDILNKAVSKKKIVCFENSWRKVNSEGFPDEKIVDIGIGENPFNVILNFASKPENTPFILGLGDEIEKKITVNIPEIPMSNVQNNIPEDETIREKGKRLGIQSWHVMKDDTLKQKIEELETTM